MGFEIHHNTVTQYRGKPMALFLRATVSFLLLSTSFLPSAVCEGRLVENEGSMARRSVLENGLGRTPPMG